MKKIRIIFTALLLFFLITNVFSQNTRTIRGKVLSSLNKPIEGAIITAAGIEGVISKADGTFYIELQEDIKQISIWALGYYPINQLIKGRSEIIFVMIPDKTSKYSESAVLPFRLENNRVELTSAVNIAKKDFVPGSMKIDRALAGQVAGLRTTRNGGMPGEGSYMNIRGIRSFVGSNAPLIVINGIPYLPDSRESQLFNGYSRNIFQAYNIEDIQNITVLKGAEASIYGSMGSNGVILIETDKAVSDDLQTRVSFFGQYGINWNNKRMPLLAGDDYKAYLSDVGMTYFDNMEIFFNEFPFLNDPSSKYQNLYNSNTNWQDEIYRKGFVTDNLFRVEGGDAIAKYNLSLGYALENGIVDYTKSQRYHTQLNTNILVSKQVELFANVGLAYLNGNYQDQGITLETNPILASYIRSPLLSPYQKDIQGKTLTSYSSYFYGKSENMDFATSNPVAIVNTLDGRNRQFDVNINAGIVYKPFFGLSFTGRFGLYYNYNKEHLFVPGVTNKSILPFMDQYGEAANTVKEGVGETFNLFANLNGHYHKIFNDIHALNVLAGMQILTTKNEYDAGVGRNTPNDFYQTLGNTQTIGRYFYGYLEKWNWMNFYGHVDYTYNELFAVSMNLAVDGASSAGSYGNRFFVYPSVGLTLLGKSWLPLSNSTFLNRLNIRAEYGLSGNSRFSSNLGKFYYTSLPYQEISGIVRGNISNTKLKPEKNAQFNIGLDMSLFYNHLSITFDYYNNQSRDVIFARPHSSAFGSGKYYDNCGKIENHGIEFAIQASLIRTHNLEWIIGGNIAHNKSKVSSLGNVNELIIKYDDGAQLISKTGEPLYQYYGYQTYGIFSTQAEAELANLTNQRGQSYNAGDVHFVDQNKDGRIDDKDRVFLGSASPSYFGGFFTNVRYKSFTLSAEFSYSKGNKAYNAVRRKLEDLSTLENQSLATKKRWTLEGQITDIPRAQWGDPVGNNSFSDRWIEDASYLRMKNITISYSFDKKFFDFFRSGTLYLTGENLLTSTKYLGMDPEFSYSYNDAIQGFDYAKMMQPKSIKIGINLNF